MIFCCLLRFQRISITVISPLPTLPDIIECLRIIYIPTVAGYIIIMKLIILLPYIDRSHLGFLCVPF